MKHLGLYLNLNDTRTSADRGECFCSRIKILLNIELIFGINLLAAERNYELRCKHNI